MMHVWRRIFLAIVSRPLLVIGMVSVSLNAGVWFMAFRLFPRRSPAAILHYSIDAGIDFVGEGQHITSLPLIGSLLLAFNAVLGAAVLKADSRASWMLWCAVPLLQVSLGLAVYLLGLVNK